RMIHPLSLHDALPIFAAFRGRYYRAVELVQPLRVAVGEPILVLTRDANDHAWPLVLCCGGSPEEIWAAPLPAPTSPFSFARSSSDRKSTRLNSSHVKI